MKKISIILMVFLTCFGSSRAQSTSSSWGICCTWNGTTCVSPKSNCFDDVVVKDLALVTRFNSFVAKGSTGVNDYFSSKEWPSLFPGLRLAQNRKYISILTTGKTSIKMVQSGNTYHYLVQDTKLQFVLHVTVAP